VTNPSGVHRLADGRPSLSRSFDSQLEKERCGFESQCSQSNPKAIPALYLNGLYLKTSTLDKSVRLNEQLKKLPEPNRYGKL